MCQSENTTQPVNPHACGCSSHGSPAARPEVGRLVPAGHDMALPEVQFPSRRVLEIAGADGLRKLVFRHHGRLRESSIGHLFTMPDEQFLALCGVIADFVVETCGGPQKFTEARGTACMRTRHFPFSIDEGSREVWIEELYHAMQETGFPAELHEEYWTWLEAMSVRMINRRTTKAQPVRISWAEAGQRYAAPATRPV